MYAHQISENKLKPLTNRMAGGNPRDWRLVLGDVLKQWLAQFLKSAKKRRSEQRQVQQQQAGRGDILSRFQISHLTFRHLHRS
jgi:hypothetical protein